MSAVSQVFVRFWFLTFWRPLYSGRPAGHVRYFCSRDSLCTPSAIAYILKSMASKSKHNNAEIALVIKLYKERKIERFDTARNIINDLSSRGIVKQQKAKDKLNFYDKEYIPRSDPLSKTILEGHNRFIKAETKTIINITINITK